MTSSVDTSFEPFARHEFYTKTNQELVDLALDAAERGPAAWPTRRVIDVACGTGAITRAVLDYYERHGGRCEILAFDRSEVALERARESTQSDAVRFIQGGADDLSTFGSAADVVLFCNAIHLIEDKHSVVRQIRDALNFGGVFAFNSSFYDGAYTEGTSRFYRKWMVRALQLVRGRAPDIRTDRNNKPEAMRWLSEEGYRELVEACGLKVTHAEQRRVEVPLEGWIDISGYRDFAEGALPGIPLELTIPALQQAVREVFAEMEVASLPRNWLQVTAQRA